jgi:hypothetical protein
MILVHIFVNGSEFEGDATYDITDEGTVDHTNDAELITRFTYNPTNVNVNTYGIPAPKLLNTTFLKLNHLKFLNQDTHLNVEMYLNQLDW